MVKTKLKNIIFPVLLVVITAVISSCYSAKEREYYAQRENYVQACGKVDFINYVHDRAELYIGFSSLEPAFGDNCFKIVGKSYDLVLERGIEEKLHIGQEVEFVSAPMIFGDGYVMPMVAISVDGEALLEFEEGFAYLQDWLK